MKLSKLSKLSGIAAIAVAASLVLSACSGGDDKSKDNQSQASPSVSDTVRVATTDADAALLKGVTFDIGEAGTEPTNVKLDADLSKLSAVGAVVVKPGTGEKIEEGDALKLNTLVVDSSGKTVGSTYTTGSPQTVSMTDPVFSQLLVALIGQNVGSWVVVGLPATEGSDGTAGADAGVMILEVASKFSAQKLENSDAVPQVEFKDEKPTISIPEGFKATEDIQVVVLKEGDGETVTTSSTITADYAGWNLKGNQFDSSFDRGEPATFPMTGVIPGWTYGLSGQKVGSQVLLIIPASYGYGDWAEGDKDDAAKGDLVFLVDIKSVDA